MINRIYIYIYIYIYGTENQNKASKKEGMHFFDHAHPKIFNKLNFYEFQQKKSGYFINFFWKNNQFKYGAY